mmetsp:Transcript_1800/g.2353  ORF Transcript_1800/g.2353 Transcript_1800/m.2353 type:complete len:92 (+) Transcript_1800:1292-1567(+)
MTPTKPIFNNCSSGALSRVNVNAYTTIEQRIAAIAIAGHAKRVTNTFRVLPFLSFESAKAPIGNATNNCVKPKKASTIPTNVFDSFDKSYR